jgi:hypothetical protein
MIQHDDLVTANAPATPHGLALRVALFGHDGEIAEHVTGRDLVFVFPHASEPTTFIACYADSSSHPTTTTNIPTAAFSVCTSG